MTLQMPTGPHLAFARIEKAFHSYNGIGRLRMGCVEVEIGNLKAAAWYDDADSGYR